MFIWGYRSRRKNNINYHQSCNPRNNIIKKTNAIECPFDNIIITILLYIKYKHRIDFNLNLLRQVREPGESGLPPSVLDRRFADVLLCHQNPFLDVDTLGSRCWLVGVLCKHPIAVLFTDLCLEWLVKADVDRLNHAGASGGDEINLDSEGLNGVYGGSHLVDRKRVQEENRDNSLRHVGNVQLEDDLDPYEHDVLAEPCLFLAGVDEVDGESWQFAFRDMPIIFSCFG